jgi:hypothetical protein
VLVLIIEVLTGVLVAVSVVVMAVALYVGLLGALGFIRLVRCDRCGHLGMTTAAAPLRACGRCRHGRLLHPLVSLHHAYVVPDRDSQIIPAIHRQSSAQKISRQPARPGARSHESAQGPSWR